LNFDLDHAREELREERM
jgi:hypothetical protein